MNKELLSNIKSMEGWLAEGEIRILYKIASTISVEGNIVEIGSYKGKSTVTIAEGNRQNTSPTLIYAIDPHCGSEEHQANGPIDTFGDFMKNIEHYLEKVTPLKKFSEEAKDEVKGPIRFLWIDGAHDYENVKKDIENYIEKVSLGGVVAFHDVHYGNEVKKAIKDILMSKGQYVFIDFSRSIIALKKVEKLSILDNCRNMFMWLYKDSYDALAYIVSKIR